MKKVVLYAIVVSIAYTLLFACNIRQNQDKTIVQDTGVVLVSVPLIDSLSLKKAEK
jgi:hypothetical protein